MLQICVQSCYGVLDQNLGWTGCGAAVQCDPTRGVTASICPRNQQLLFPLHPLQAPASTSLSTHPPLPLHPHLPVAFAWKSCSTASCSPSSRLPSNTIARTPIVPLLTSPAWTAILQAIRSSTVLAPRFFLSSQPRSGSCSSEYDWQPPHALRPSIEAAARFSIPVMSSAVAGSASAAAGSLKRKRESKNTLKFYAVRTGKQPGIYHSWNDCLDQVKGFPKAVFKSFTSLAEAEGFVRNETGSSDGRVVKWYGVRAGRKPGVYTNWQDVLDQITGWKAPKHKGFKTRAEAEQYVTEGQLPPTVSASTVPTAGRDVDGPAQKKAKVSKSRKSAGFKDEQHSPSPALEPQGEYEPGEAPLASDAEDGFDAAIILDQSINGLRYRTREERERLTYQAVRPVASAPIRIYTDGSALSNGQRGAVGGIGVWFGSGDSRNLSEALPGTKQTNQRAELSAFVRALECAPRDRKIVIVSDSKYAIDCVTDWAHGWRKNGWLTASKRPVENKDLVIKTLDLLEERLKLHHHRMTDADRATPPEKHAHWDRGPAGVRFEWVKGHAKDAGNEAADQLAVHAAKAAKQVAE